VIKNTLEFDPDIMKRYVNFMSNPDERTAIDQFGKGDKCFGVAALMATLPGLPMFGHGQIEGFTEKYGMEYQRPRYDERPDHWLIERHDREIAPLLKRRWLFAESSSFLLYDFFQGNGSVDENIFAYSNRNGGERALVVFNNRYGATHGTIDFSAAYADKGAGQLRQQRLREGLGLSGDGAAILAFRDSLTGLEYLRRADELRDRGLTLDLHAYQCHVFLDWRELRVTAQQPWDKLCAQLNGRGVANLDDALVSLELRPVHDALRAQLDSAVVRIFADLAEHPRAVAAGPTAKDKKIEMERREFFDMAWRRCEMFLHEAQKAYVSRAGLRKEGMDFVALTSPALLGPAFRERLRGAMRIPVVEALFPTPWTAAARRVLPSPSPQFTATAMWGPVLAWCALELLAESIYAEKPERIALDLFDRLRLREPFAQAFTELGFEGEEGWRVAARIKVVLLSGAGVGRDEKPPVVVEEPEDSKGKTAAKVGTEMSADEPADLSEDEGVGLSAALWLDPDVRWLTGVHEADGHEYLVRESYEELLWWLQMPRLLKVASEPVPDRGEIQAMGGSVEEALELAEAAGYRVDALAGAAVADQDAEIAIGESEEAAVDEELDSAPVDSDEGPPAHAVESKANAIEADSDEPEALESKEAEEETR
jgi:hypothetical protein